MTNEEKRYDAAHTLVVPYDATPAAVDAAYAERMRQYLDIKVDNDLLQTKTDHLYDARIRMRMSPSRQWIANAKIRLSDRFERDCAVMIALVNSICGEMGTAGDWHNKELNKLITRVRKLEHEKKAICLFELASIWIVPYIDNMAASMAGFAAMVAAAIRMAWCMAKRDKKIREFSRRSSAMIGEIFLLKLQGKIK